MADQEALLRELEQYTPADDEEARSHAFICNFLRQETAPFSRATLHGHITSSAYVTDTSYGRILMVWHRKLERWLQPGGHVEPGDASVYDAALREVLEETGHQAQAGPLGKRVFDVDVHKIPARKSEPEHLHLDVRFVFVVGEKIAEPDHELRWLPLEEAGQGQDHSTVRAVGKIAKLRASDHE